MLSIEIKENKHRQIAAKLSYIGRNLANPKGLYARWAVTSLKWVDDNFRKEGALLADGPWPKLKESTRRGRSGGKILQRTGRLRRSYTYRITKGGLILGTSVSYAIYHESDNARSVIPQRRMLPRSRDKSFTDRLTKVSLNYVKELIKKGRV